MEFGIPSTLKTLDHYPLFKLADDLIKIIIKSRNEYEREKKKSPCVPLLGILTLLYFTLLIIIIILLLFYLAVAQFGPNSRSIPTVRCPCHRRVLISILSLPLTLTQIPSTTKLLQTIFKPLSKTKKPQQPSNLSPFQFFPPPIILLSLSISIYPLARLQTLYSPLSSFSKRLVATTSLAPIRFKPPKHAIFFSTPGQLPVTKTTENPLFPRLLFLP